MPVTAYYPQLFCFRDAALLQRCWRIVKAILPEQWCKIDTASSPAASTDKPLAMLITHDFSGV
jgi:hypothetical protein